MLCFRPLALTGLRTACRTQQTPGKLQVSPGESRCALALEEVLQDEAQVAQPVFEGWQGQDGGLVRRVQLQHRQEPPAPRGPVRRGLQPHFTAIYGNLPHFTKIYHNLLQFTAIYHNLLQFTTIYYNLPQFTTICHNLLHFTTF